MNERERRLAENESLFREVNERTKDVNAGWSRVEQAAPPFQIVCECGREDCALPLGVTAELYEAVRADGARFLVAEGHELPGVERIVDRTRDVLVIEKIGTSRLYVERLDPRARR